ncbi:hypothetical protein C8R44DRAFT_754008 [Mycena epipterygia]|nr:hypothetical protein C8R44DRAFT_754008 [Mycena epipterygia]
MAPNVRKPRRTRVRIPTVVFSAHPKNSIEVKFSKQKSLLGMGITPTRKHESTQVNVARTNGGKGTTGAGMGMGQAEEYETTRGRTEADARAETTRMEGNQERAKTRGEERAERARRGGMDDGMSVPHPTSSESEAEGW